MKKILITGASGFIGRHCLTLLLEKGYEVHALALEPAAGYEKDIIWHCQNFLDNEKSRNIIETVKPSQCLHLAWYTEPKKYWQSAENLRWLASSILLLYHFQQQGGERFVGAGSSAEYNWNFGHCSETTTPLEPATLYGTCKNALQKTLASFSESTSLSSAWGRVFFLYGPHEHPNRLVAAVINSLIRGEPALCSHGNQIRDFMHVRDVADAFISILESRVDGPINIASGVPITVKDVVHKIADRIGSRDMLRFGALPSEANQPKLLTADVTRLNHEVGFFPKYSLESGLEQTIDWWKHFIEKQS